MFGAGWEKGFAIIFIFAIIGALCMMIGGIWVIFEMFMHLRWS